MLIAGLLNPHPIGVSRVTHPVGGGGGAVSTTPWSPKLQNRFPKFKCHSILVRELCKHGVIFDPNVTDDVTGQVKVRMFDFSVLVTLASTILMLSARKTNESAWVVSLTFVFCKYHSLCVVTIIPTGQGHLRLLRSSGKKGQTKT